ncbi:MAG TPA: SdrD B-like domain-containing protein, partial [Tepidisphaeraceae bacterium]|nr:SdrD B-like domain-containing protein [Tepidisphaeraceae bacterium]
MIEPLEVRLLLSAAVRAVVPDVHTASISGLTYIDSNHDGYHGSDEAGVGGLTIYLDSNRNGQLDPVETSVMTDDSGTYSFTGLRAGTYYVAELPDQDFGQTAPTGEQKVKLKARHAVTQINFANQPLTDDALFPGETFEQHGGEGTIPAQQTTDAGPGDPIGANASLPVSAGTWTSLGPAPISNGQTPGSNPVSGRIVGIAPDPTNA